MNGYLQWGKRVDMGTKHLSHSDMTLYRMPFVLSFETSHRLGQLPPAKAERELRGLMWPALVARNSSGGIIGSSYGSVSHSIEEIEYVPGAPAGHVTVGESFGIGD
jgi:hypothetical protein